MSKSIRLAFAVGLGIVFVLSVSVFAFAGDSTGSAVYQQYCAGCHGSNGQGTAYGPNIQGESAREVSSVTREGDDEMPGYNRSIITDSQLGALSAYVAGLESSSDDEYDRDDDDDHNAGGSQYGGNHDDDDDDDHGDDDHNDDHHDSDNDHNRRSNRSHD